jgi:hypothetical protein
MSLKKPVASLALLFVFVLVGVFAFQASLKGMPMNECCDLYYEGYFIGKGDWHPVLPSGFCDCTYIQPDQQRPNPCNPSCVYYCLN